MSSADKISQAGRRAEARDRKRRKTMVVSGKQVLLMAKLIKDKRPKRGSK